MTQQQKDSPLLTFIVPEDAWYGIKSEIELSIRELTGTGTDEDDVAQGLTDALAKFERSKLTCELTWEEYLEHLNEALWRSYPPAE